MILVEIRAEEPISQGRPDMAAAAARTQPHSVMNGLSFALNVLSLGVAVILIVVLFFTWQSVRHLSALESRLADLSRFEERMGARLDVVNQGFHSQFDELNRRISTVILEVEQARTDLDATVRELRSLTRERELTSGAIQGGARSERREIVLPAPLPATSPPPSEASESSTSPDEPAASPLFQRQVSPDGRVTYSRR